MRASERVAAFAVAAMTAPAFLVFPILGLWYVVRVWPNMSLVDRSIFCSAVAVFFASVPICFRHGMRRVKQGHSEGMATADKVLMLIPIIAGGWALTHQLDILLFMAVLLCWDAYKTHKRQREVTPGRIMSP